MFPDHGHGSVTYAMVPNRRSVTSVMVQMDRTLVFMIPDHDSVTLYDTVGGLETETLCKKECKNK
jgi:hypothetical protein